MPLFLRFFDEMLDLLPQYGISFFSFCTCTKTIVFVLDFYDHMKLNLLHKFSTQLITVSPCHTKKVFC